MHVAVLGAGYAGVALTRCLESRLPPEVDITLVNEHAEHVLVHETHRAIRRPAVADAVSVPLADLLDRAELVVDRVVDVDAEAGRAELASGDPVEWDYGAVCLGSETAYYGIDGLREHATPMKSLDDAAAVREAKTAAENIGRLVDHELAAAPDDFRPRLTRYRFDVPGWLVSVGDGAVAQLGPTVLTGAPARASKASVGAGYLTSVGAVDSALDLVEEELL